MVYRDAERKDCKVCGRLRREGERFSVRGKCSDCATGRMLENRRQLQARKGPLFEHWYEQMRARFEYPRLPPSE